MFDTTFTTQLLVLIPISSIELIVSNEKNNAAQEYLQISMVLGFLKFPYNFPHLFYHCFSKTHMNELNEKRLIYRIYTYTQYIYPYITIRKSKIHL